jgi:hypothetical protein
MAASVGEAGENAGSAIWIRQDLPGYAKGPALVGFDFATDSVEVTAGKKNPPKRGDFSMGEQRCAPATRGVGRQKPPRQWVG